MMTVAARQQVALTSRTRSSNPTIDLLVSRLESAWQQVDGAKRRTSNSIVYFDPEGVDRAAGFVDDSVLLVRRLKDLGGHSVLVHETNNLLGTAMGYIALLQDGGSLASSEYASTESALVSAIKSAVLFGGGDVIPSPQMAEVKILDAFAWSRLVDERKFTMEKRMYSDTVQGDLEQLRHALHNFMLNATDAMGNQGRLEFVAYPVAGDDQNFMRLEVRDYGPGIAAEQREKVWQRKETSKQGHSGIGLYLAQEIAKNHGGYARCYSRPGQGSSFVLYVPTDAEVENDKGTGNIVGFNEREASFLNRQLQKQGYQVVENSSDPRLINTIGPKAFTLAKTAQGVAESAASYNLMEDFYKDIARQQTQVRLLGSHAGNFYIRAHNQAEMQSLDEIRGVTEDLVNF